MTESWTHGLASHERSWRDSIRKETWGELEDTISTQVSHLWALNPPAALAGKNTDGRTCLNESSRALLEQMESPCRPEVDNRLLWGSPQSRLQTSPTALGFFFIIYLCEHIIPQSLFEIVQSGQNYTMWFLPIMWLGSYRMLFGRLENSTTFKQGASKDPTKALKHAQLAEIVILVVSSSYSSPSSRLGYRDLPGQYGLWLEGLPWNGKIWSFTSCICLNTSVCLRGLWDATQNH